MYKGQMHRSKLITHVRFEKEMAGLHTHSVTSCNSLSHMITGQNTSFTDSSLANIGYILDFLQTIYGLLCHYYEPNGV